MRSLLSFFTVATFCADKLHSYLPLKYFLQILLSIQFLLLFGICWFTGPGWDEWGHLPSGLYSLQYGDFSPYSVNPPLARLLAALPVWALGGGVDRFNFTGNPGSRPEWELAFFYVISKKEDCFFWFFIARLTLIPLCLFGTYVIWRIALILYGKRPAILAASLWAFSPTSLNYGASITPDICVTVFSLFTVLKFYRFIQKPTLLTSTTFGLSFGLALSSKFTAILLLPVFILYFVWYFRSRFILNIFLFFWSVLLSLFVIACVYDFDRLFFSLGSFEFVSSALKGPENSEFYGNRFSETICGIIPMPVPADYIKGIDIQKRDFEGNFKSYLFGETRDSGWYYYYLVSLFLKEPIAIWIMLLASIAFYTTSHRFDFESSNNYGLEILIYSSGLFVFLFVSSQTGFNHHFRYVLPFLPSFYLLISKVFFLKIHRRSTVTLIITLGFYIYSSLSVYPREYAFFSEAVGGSENGWKYLEGSNLDWGQDLPAVKEWVKQNIDKKPIKFLYFPEFHNFSLIGIDVIPGYNLIDGNGPKEGGWWIVCNGVLVDNRFKFFRDLPPNHKISVSTNVFYVEK